MTILCLIKRKKKNYKIIWSLNNYLEIIIFYFTIVLIHLLI